MSEVPSPHGEMGDYGRERDAREALRITLEQFAYRRIIPAESIETMTAYLSGDVDDLDTADYRLGILVGDKISAVLSRRLDDERDGFTSAYRPGNGEVLLVSDMLGSSRDGRAPIPRQEAVDRNRGHLLEDYGFHMMGSHTVDTDQPIPESSIDQSIVGVLSWLNQPLRKRWGTGSR